MKKAIMSKVNKVKELQASGVPINEAFKKAKIGSATYYKYKDNGKVQVRTHEAPVKEKRQYEKKTKRGQVVVMLGSPSEIAEILKEIK